MLKPENVPDEVKRAMRAAWARRNNSDAPEKIMADLAIAALKAWPGVRIHGDTYVRKPSHHLILPLPQEPRDD